MQNKEKNVIILIFIIILIGIGILLILSTLSTVKGFNGEQAYKDVNYQVSIGPRLPGSDAHNIFVNWAIKSFSASGWQVEIQEGEKMGHPIRNIIARRGQGSPWIIIGAHYDSRFIANKDLDKELRNQPVPGANDGASGVAVLLELARVLPKSLEKQIWLVLFDAEDQGSIPGWEYILGSRLFVEKLQGTPDAVVIIDMIGDASLNIYQERSSNPEINRQIWEKAASLGYSNFFISKKKYNMLDDHTPFLEKGIPAVDLIDFDYPYWHTTQDTTDKVSADSLEIVGKTLQNWIESQY